ncbi:MAG: ADP-ribose pyrophosphatase YjhB (NUDIX family) [Neolewinella sp.]|jgi:ADP-ribose pyrophosphatase YjhB (NUDIX family)
MFFPTLPIMNFCSNCGSKIIGLIIPEGDNRERFVCNNCTTIHYQNPNIVAGCLPVWEDRVLLCRRAIEPRHGLWNIPSGYLENGESVEDGALREVWEEAAAKVKIDYLITLYNLPKINQIYLQFVGELVDGEFGVGEESLECALFTEKSIPWEEMAFTSSTFTLRRHFENLRAGRKLLHRGIYPEVQELEN